jgi:hypothetical protein
LVIGYRVDAGKCAGIKRFSDSSLYKNFKIIESGKRRNFFLGKALGAGA